MINKEKGCAAGTAQPKLQEMASTNIISNGTKVRNHELADIEDGYAAVTHSGCTNEGYLIATGGIENGY